MTTIMLMALSQETLEVKRDNFIRVSSLGGYNSSNLYAPNCIDSKYMKQKLNYKDKQISPQLYLWIY